MVMGTKGVITVSQNVTMMQNTSCRHTTFCKQWRERSGLLVTSAAHLGGLGAPCVLYITSPCSRCPLAIISGRSLCCRCAATMHGQRGHVRSGSVTAASVKGWRTYSRLSYFCTSSSAFWSLLGAALPLCLLFQRLTCSDPSVMFTTAPLFNGFKYILVIRCSRLWSLSHSKCRFFWWNVFCLF